MKLTSAGYLQAALTPDKFRKILNKLSRNIHKANIIFESIAFRGMSWTLVAPTIAFRLKKNPVLIRKECDGSHSGRSIEAEGDIVDYIIIDDLIESGDTMKKIIEAMNGRGITPDHCKGIFLYGSTSKQTVFEGQIKEAHYKIPKSNFNM